MDKIRMGITPDGEILMGDERPADEKKTRRQTKRERDGIMGTFEFFDKIPDEAAAVAFLEKRRWGDNPTCPHCESENVGRTSASSPMPWRCRSCRKHFSVRTNTVMAQSRIPLKKWLYAIYLFHTNRKGISAKQLERELKLTYKSAWFLAHRIRKAMEYPGPMLAGEVEIDEAFVGGKSGRKHFLKREDDRDKREWGIPSHQIVLGMKERGGNIVAYPIGGRDSYALHEMISQNVEPGSLIYTDGHAPYRHMIDYDHDWVNHRKREYVRGAAHTNGIESFWAIFKRGYNGVYHFMSNQHLHRYTTEFAHRYNAGPGNDFEVIGRTCDGMEGKRLTYKDLTYWFDINDLPDWLAPADNPTEEDLVIPLALFMKGHWTD